LGRISSSVDKVIQKEIDQLCAKGDETVIESRGADVYSIRENTAKEYVKFFAIPKSVNVTR
jgi:hypothetical protein